MAACGLLVVCACAITPVERELAADPVSPQAIEPRFAKYLASWVAKVERMANVNYPVEARGISGSVRLSVSIKPDGSVEAIRIDRSSGYDVLDGVAVRLVELASPFAPFPPEISEDTSLVTITRTWTFWPHEWIEIR